MKAVLVIDMLKGFCKKGAPLYVGDVCDELIPKMRKFLLKAKEENVPIFYICDSHSRDDLEFKMFHPHCIEGTEESELVDEFKGISGEMIKKNRYSGFFNTNLDSKLKEMGIKKLEVIGVATDICVLHTVADARNRDYEVEVIEDLVGSFNKEAHDFALKHIKRVLGASIKRFNE